jgi:hypothetical protein
MAKALAAKALVAKTRVTIGFFIFCISSIAVVNTPAKRHVGAIRMAQRCGGAGVRTLADGVWRRRPQEAFPMA